MVSKVDRRRAGTGRRAAGFLAAGVFAAVLLGVLGVVQRLPTTYAATSVVAFLPRSDAPVGADTVQLVGEKYAVLATAPDVLQNVGRVTGEQEAGLRAATVATLAAGTGNLQVTVTLPNADRAARVANAVADQLVRSSVRDQLVGGELISRAVGPDADVRPARMLLRGAGLLAAALAAALIWALVAGGRRRAAREEPWPRARDEAWDAQ
jgi:hypothetical protein